MAPSLISNATALLEFVARAADAGGETAGDASSGNTVPFHFDPFEVTTTHIIYVGLGGFIVLFGMFSLILREKLYIGEACWAFIFGVVVGPYGAGVFNPREWGASGHTEADEDTTNAITLEFTRVILSIGVFAIGVELPKQYMKIHWKSLAFMLGPIMAYGWFITAALIFGLIPRLGFLASLAIAACMTPTDPILAAAVVGGRYAEKHVPAHIRHLLAAESGCNDGAAFPFLFLALYLLLDSPDTGAAIRDWFVLLWIYQIILGTVIGATLGFAFRHLMKFCERNHLIDRHSYVAQYLSLAILTTGVTIMLGSDDLLSTFACGTAFAWDGFFNRQTEESVFSSIIDLLFNIAAFIYVGAWMPFNDFQTDDLQVWRLVVLAICVLLIRRLPVVLALYKWIPDIKTFQEALFTGHFGPIGIGAVFISTLANEFIHGYHRRPTDPYQTEQIEILERTIQPISAFLVLWSIAIHGLSIPGFTLSKRVRSITMTRTWTRERSVTSTRRQHEPEWMDQIQHGGVITRTSPDIEAGLNEKELSTSSTSSPRKDPATMKEESRKEEGEAWKEELPPDGTANVQIWDEGPHRIIERRKGPGEEVEVEVIRYYNVDHRENEVSHHRIQADNVKHHITNYLRKLEADAEGLLHHSPKPSFHRQKPADGSKAPPPDIVVDQDVEDENPSEVFEESSGDEAEGWVDQPGSANASPTMDRKVKPRAGKRAPPKLGSTPVPPSIASGSSSRRRSSHSSGTSGFMRKTLMTKLSTSPKHSVSPTSPLTSSPLASPPQMDSEVTNSSPNEEEDRGRTMAPKLAPRKKTHSRMDSLKTPVGGRSRDASPARSIRFGDTPTRATFEEGRLGGE
ncbi:Sodium/hydrogen exchanger family-domain-containing protein [Flagelloscypha sp. PMI_526]|nr:Sodium/hydrogen exchanger family-domain-containing protein [Flagelloscypha sp. PMI_526]